MGLALMMRQTFTAVSSCVFRSAARMECGDSSPLCVLTMKSGEHSPHSKRAVAASLNIHSRNAVINDLPEYVEQPTVEIHGSG